MHGDILQEEADSAEMRSKMQTAKGLLLDMNRRPAWVKHPMEERGVLEKMSAPMSQLLIVSETNDVLERPIQSTEPQLRIVRDAPTAEPFERDDGYRSHETAF